MHEKVHKVISIKDDLLDVRVNISITLGKIEYVNKSPV